MSEDTTPPPAQPVWFDLSSRQPADAARFYGQLFGWTVTSRDDYTFISSGDSPPSGGIGRASDDSPYVGLVPYFPVDDLDAALERARQLGATVLMEPTPTPDARIAAIKDPEGTTVGLQGP